jgi:glycosyltransferase involved in cell wall biosynthesis
MHLVFLGSESIAVPHFDRILGELAPEVRAFVHIDSGIKDGDLLEMYRAATLFVYPSKAEGFGIPPLEAAALRIPTLCSNSAAMKDFSFFGRNQIDPYDYTAFRQRLQEVLADPPDQAFLDEVSAIVRREYSWEVSALKLYELLVQGYREPDRE